MSPVILLISISHLYKNKRRKEYDLRVRGPSEGFVNPIYHGTLYGTTAFLYVYVKKKLLEPIPKQKLAVMNVKILTSETCVKKDVVDASIA